MDTTKPFTYEVYEYLINLGPLHLIRIGTKTYTAKVTVSA